MVDYKLTKVSCSAVDSIMIHWIDSSKLDAMSVYYSNLCKMYDIGDCIFIQPISLKYNGFKIPSNTTVDLRILLPFFDELKIQLQPKIMLDMMEITIFDSVQ